jgi:hypothetical protein
MKRSCSHALFAFMAVFWAAACGGDDGAEGVDGGLQGTDGGGPMVCTATAPTACPEPSPRYADVEPIFMERCVTCHGGVVGGPWPLTTHGHIATWANEIRGELLDCTMPPADAGAPMTDDEREAILVWLRCGFPE